MFFKKHRKKLLTALGFALVLWFVVQCVAGFWLGSYKAYNLSKDIKNLKYQKTYVFDDVVSKEGFVVFEDGTSAYKPTKTYHISKAKKGEINLVASLETKSYRDVAIGVSGGNMYFLLYELAKKKGDKNKISLGIYDILKKKFVDKKELNALPDMNNVHARLLDKENIVLSGTCQQKEANSTQCLILYNTKTEKTEYHEHEILTWTLIPVEFLNNGDLLLSYRLERGSPALKCYSFQDKKIYTVKITNGQSSKIFKESLNPNAAKKFIWLGDDNFVVAQYDGTYNTVNFDYFKIEDGIAKNVHQTAIQEKCRRFPASLSLRNSVAFGGRYVLFFGGQYGFGLFTWYSKKCFVYDAVENKAFFIRDFPYRINRQKIYVDNENNIWILGGGKIVLKMKFPFYGGKDLDKVYRYKFGKIIKESKGK